MARSPAAKPQNTATMISAAPAMSRAVEPDAGDDCIPGLALCLYLPLDPAEQEHLGVHREAEEHGEQEHRHEGLDRVNLL